MSMHVLDVHNINGRALTKVSIVSIVFQLESYCLCPSTYTHFRIRRRNVVLYMRRSMLSGRQHTECCVCCALAATAHASASLDGSLQRVASTALSNSLQLDFGYGPVSIFVRKSEAAFALRLFSERERQYLYCCTNKASKVSTFVISRR